MDCYFPVIRAVRNAFAARVAVLWVDARSRNFIPRRALHLCAHDLITGPSVFRRTALSTVAAFSLAAVRRWRKRPCRFQRRMTFPVKGFPGMLKQSLKLTSAPAALTERSLGDSEGCDGRWLQGKCSAGMSLIPENVYCQNVSYMVNYIPTSW